MVGSEFTYTNVGAVMSHDGNQENENSTRLVTLADAIQ